MHKCEYPFNGYLQFYHKPTVASKVLSFKLVSVLKPVEGTFSHYRYIVKLTDIKRKLHLKGSKRFLGFPKAQQA